MNKIPKIKDLFFSWAKNDNLQQWELDCEKAFQKFLIENPRFSDVPFKSMYFKKIWVTCIKNYSK